MMELKVYLSRYLGVYREFHVFTDVHVVHSRGLTLTTRVKFKTLWASQLIIINCSLKKKKKSSLLIEAIFRILWTHCWLFWHSYCWIASNLSRIASRNIWFCVLLRFAPFGQPHQRSTFEFSYLRHSYSWY